VLDAELGGGLRAAYASRDGAALAAAVCGTVAAAAHGGLGAALGLAPLAPAMSRAKRLHQPGPRFKK